MAIITSGLSNAAQTFQHMMDRTIDGLEGVFAYMNDSRVGSPNRQTHLLHLEAFFNALATNGLLINLEKCVFAVLSVEILNHTISATGSTAHGQSCRLEQCLPMRRPHWRVGAWQEALGGSQSACGTHPLPPDVGEGERNQVGLCCVVPGLQLPPLTP
jgi:hypothetical protein